MVVGRYPNTSLPALQTNEGRLQELKTAGVLQGEEVFGQDELTDRVGEPGEALIELDLVVRE